MKNGITRDEAVRFLLTNPAEYGRLVGFSRFTEIHNGWIRSMLDSGDDRTLWAHRGSYKTSCVSTALAILLILFPRERILFLRKTDGDVREVMRQTAKILSHPVTFCLVRAIWGIPLRLTTATGTEITTNLVLGVTGTAQLVGMGCGGSLTGKHFDRIFTDDIVNLSDRYSFAEREQTKVIYEELQNVKNRGGRIFNTGTPWHPDDAFTRMPPPEKYDCYRTDLIDPEELARIRASLSPSLFAANYELRHISDGQMFAQKETAGDESLAYDGICHMDAAYGGGDYTAFTVCKASCDGKFYIYGRIWHSHADDAIPEISALFSRFRCSRLYCEDNGDKGYLARELRRAGVRVSSYHESMNKDLKISTYLRGAYPDIVFVSGTDPEYVRQIADYCAGAGHDDAPDSAASAIRATEKCRGTAGVSLWK